MKKILIVHPELRPRGGSEARPLWIAQALKEDHEVTLISQGNIDFPLLNEAYGTSLQEKEVKKIELPYPSSIFTRFDAYRSLPLIRYCQAKANEFDILISSYNVLDLKKRGIQFIADFSFSDRLRRKFNPQHGWFNKLKYEFSPLRAIYLKIAQWISRTSSSGWKHNLTVANSKWTQLILKAEFNINSEVIYPPVKSPDNKVSWEDREEGFVILGRISPEKKIEQAIEIVRRVRDYLSHKNLHLHILGGSGPKSGYYEKLRTLTKNAQDWIFWEGPVFGPNKYAILQKHKYGLNCRPFEPFGIAVAEMVKSGCLVWVPKRGGQEEIVSHPDLIYNNLEEAVQKTIEVVENERRELLLRQHLAEQALKFSTEAFTKKVRNLISQFE